MCDDVGFFYFVHTDGQIQHIASVVFHGLDFHQHRHNAGLGTKGAHEDIHRIEEISLSTSDLQKEEPLTLELDLGTKKLTFTRASTNEEVIDRLNENGVTAFTLEDDKKTITLYPDKEGDETKGISPRFIKLKFLSDGDFYSVELNTGKAIKAFFNGQS